MIQISLILAGLVIFLVVFLYVGVPLVHGRCARLMLKRKAIKSKSLVLTFDDGPGSRLTPAILSILGEYNTKAAFFLLGRNIRGSERIVRQIAEQGHEICSHGYDHLHYWKVSPIRAVKDMKLGWHAIDTALGTNRGQYPFRPPNGRLNIVCLLYLLVYRVPIVYWSLDLGDTWRLKPDSQRLALLVKKAGGAVILAHDFDRSDNSADQLVLESVRSALAIAKETGIETLNVSKFLYQCK